MKRSETNRNPRGARAIREYGTRGSLVILDERGARSAATLRYAHPACGVADAVVVATADAVPGSTILTSDPHDLRSLAAVRGWTSIVPF